MKKVLAMTISIILAFFAATGAAETENEYGCSEWAVENIERALSVSLMDSEKNYDYKSKISRLEFCELIFNVVVQTPFFAEWYEKNADDSDETFRFKEKFFDDLEDSRVNFLHYIGIIYGKTEREFAPNDGLTREEAAVIIVRMIDRVINMETTEMWYDYNDVDEISDWSLNSVQKISNLGFMKGIGDNKFAPKDIYTIEQAVATVVRVFDANIIEWIAKAIKKDAGAIGYVYENDTWNYVTYDMAVGRRVTPLDVNKDEFRLLNYETFAADDESVYFMAHKIEDADPATFQVIDNTGNMRYAKDKNFVYIYLKDGGIMKVIGADPETFEALEYPYAKDKNDAYNGCLPLYVDDVTKFEVVESGSGATRISFPESFLTTAINSEEIAKYNNEKYGFINSAVIYSPEGIAKTESLVYKGYILEEDNRLKQ